MKIAAKLEKGDRFFLFYAGHGQNFEGSPAISCYDTTPDDKTTWHDVIDLMKTVKENGCEKILLS